MPVGQSGVANADMLTRLRGIARSRETIDIAQLQFVGLDKIRSAYGERWPAHKSRIHDAAESFLRRRIGESDLLIRSEGGFLVVLSASQGPEAHAVAAQLTHGLNAFFTGQVSDFAAPRFDSSVQNVATKDLERLGRALDAGEPAAGAVSREADEISWKFEPVWDVRHEALSYWYVTPFSAAAGVRIPGYQFETSAATAAQFVKLDEASLWIAEQALQDLARSGKQALVGATLHAHSLVNLASRARLFATIRRLNPELHRFRIIKIAGISQGFPRMYVRELIGALRSRLPNIVLSASWDEPDLETLLEPGLSGIGLVAPASGVASTSFVGIPALMARVSYAVKLAHHARMRFFVEGAVTKYLALKFSQAGVDNISSHGIWPAREMAEGVERWSTERLAA